MFIFYLFLTFVRMSLMTEEWKNRITFNPSILAGKPIIKGTRIAVEFILDLLVNWLDN